MDLKAQITHNTAQQEIELTDINFFRYRPTHLIQEDKNGVLQRTPVDEPVTIITSNIPEELFKRLTQTIEEFYGE